MNSPGAESIHKKIISAYPSEGQKKKLPELCAGLWEEQKANWPQLRDGAAALTGSRVRKMVCRDFEVTIAGNPKRIQSTGANLDPKVIQARQCFLCPAHLPELQKGLLYNDEYLILCNPAPLFSPHFTCASIHHRRQELEPSLGVLLDCAKDVTPEYTVFYNGPRCGASAPDHFHFQISPRRALPVESDAVDCSKRKRLYYHAHCAAYVLSPYGRSVLIVEATDRERLMDLLKTIIAQWKNFLSIQEEPMMNILCSFQEDLWRCIVFPRKKHRPDVYYREGAEKILVSPAAADMGGFLVTPREHDFQNIDAQTVEMIFAEVSMPSSFLEKIFETIK